MKILVGIVATAAVAIIGFVCLAQIAQPIDDTEYYSA